MIVTLDVFSGLPNPSWTLNEKEAGSLTERLAGKALPAASLAEDVLGYRGFVVMAASDDGAQKAALPEAFRVGGSLEGELVVPERLAASAIRREDADDAASWLLSTARGQVDDDLLSYVEGVIKDPDLQRKSPEDLKGPVPKEDDQDEQALAEARKAGLALAACLIANTPYNPGFWNVSSVQPYNNCYNYAMNWRSNTFAQPGRISGHPNSVMQCANVGTAANWDGCTTFCSGSNKNVALVVWPGRDYHWYRKHSEGFWGHKPGNTAARNTDNSGRLIGGALTPANCNRGPYTSFCGYRFSPTGMQVR